MGLQCLPNFTEPGLRDAGLHGESILTKISFSIFKDSQFEKWDSVFCFADFRHHPYRIVSQLLSQKCIPIREKVSGYNFSSKGSRSKNFNRETLNWKSFGQQNLNRPLNFHDLTRQHLLLLLIQMFTQAFRCFSKLNFNSYYFSIVLEQKIMPEMLQLMR